VAFFHEQVLPDPGIQSLLLSDECQLPTHYMGLVDGEGAPNFYHGALRIVSAKGAELYCGPAGEALSLIEERSEPWTYVKFPYLKELGWKGFSAGEDSGIYRVGPLARVNVAERMATPLAQEEFERFFDHFGERPVHATFAYHWARLVEMVQAAEDAARLSEEDALTGAEVRGELGQPGEGIGVIEAARGTLFHHYQLDGEGLVERVNLIVATTHNAAGIGLSVKQMAERVVREGELDERLSTGWRWRSGPTTVPGLRHPLPPGGDAARGGDLWGGREAPAACRALRRRWWPWGTPIGETTGGAPPCSAY